MEFEYLTLIACGTQLPEKLYKVSKLIRDAIKGGNPKAFPYLIKLIRENNLEYYFADSCLIPAPKSSLIRKDFLKPSMIISQAIVKANLASSIADIAIRHTAIRNSSHCMNADERPSVKEHRDTIDITQQLITESTLIIVDDVLSLGRTSVAVALQLKERYPEKNIKVFSPVKTTNRDKVSHYESISQGKLYYSDYTGKVSFK